MNSVFNEIVGLSDRLLSFSTLQRKITILNYQTICGFVCAYHPVAAGSNPKHTFPLFWICIVVIENVIDEWEKDENKPEIGRDWPILKL